MLNRFGQVFTTPNVVHANFIESTECLACKKKEIIICMRKRCTFRRVGISLLAIAYVYKVSFTLMLVTCDCYRWKCPEWLHRYVDSSNRLRTNLTKEKKKQEIVRQKGCCLSNVSLKSLKKKLSLPNRMISDQREDCNLFRKWSKYKYKGGQFSVARA